MRGRLAFGILVAAIVLAAQPSVALAADIDTSNIRVKQAIADTMTPEELQAYKERLALNFANLPQTEGFLGSRTPGDTCIAATFEISTLPYGPFADTTVGATDDYDLPADTTAPTCTAAVTCTGGGAGQGNIYTGTGTGPDRAFRVRTDADCTLTITMDPTGSEDMALITYLANCSSSLADCACVDDTGVGGVAEVVTLNAVAGTDYFVVVDGYSTSATPPGPSGPYTLSITGSGCNLVPVTLQGFSAE